MTTGRPCARILEVTSYPPPRAGWGIRVEFLKKRLDAEGHSCVVLNIGTSRAIPSSEYEMVLGGRDFIEKVWRYARRGYTVHAHANGDAIKGLLLALLAQLIGLASGRRPILTFHAGVIQRFFPLERSWRHAPLFWLLFALPGRIICNSAAVKAKIQDYGASGNKIVPIAAFSKQYMEYAPAPLPTHLEEFFAKYPHVVFTYVRMRPLFYPLTMVDGMAELVKRRPDVGLAVCGMSGHTDEGVWEAVETRIHEHGLEPHLCLIEDLDHDAFLTALTRSSLYLRTPITDGVASSVLESLALGIPVVACENGTRPKGVLTYTADDASGMAARMEHVIANRRQVVEAMGALDVPDTLADEIALLTARA
jgi:glycosyltransferase involved in cell wall biosynthesis